MLTIWAVFRYYVTVLLFVLSVFVGGCLGVNYYVKNCLQVVERYILDNSLARD